VYFQTSKLRGINLFNSTILNIQH